MSLISDVREGVRALDLSGGSLRKFGLMVGSVFMLIAALLFLGGRTQALSGLLGIVGAALVTVGAFSPRSLRGIYRLWMALALVVGWFVSRVLLTVLFFMVVTPIGLTARILGKRFMDVDIQREKESYWVRRQKDKKVNYEKMY